MDRTVCVGSRKHAGGLQLLRLGLVVNHVACATKLKRFRGSWWWYGVVLCVLYSHNNLRSYRSGSLHRLAASIGPHHLQKRAKLLRDGRRLTDRCADALVGTHIAHREHACHVRLELCLPILREQ